MSISVHLLKVKTQCVQSVGQKSKPCNDYIWIHPPIVCITEFHGCLTSSTSIVRLLNNKNFPGNNYRWRRTIVDEEEVGLSPLCYLLDWDRRGRMMSDRRKVLKFFRFSLNASSSLPTCFFFPPHNQVIAKLIPLSSEQPTYQSANEPMRTVQYRQYRSKLKSLFSNIYP